MYSYKLKSPATDQYRSGWPFGGSGARGNSTSHWLRSGGGKNPCRHHLYFAEIQRSNKVWRREEKRETGERNVQLITFLQSWVRKLYWPISSAPEPRTSIPPYLHSQTHTASDLPSSTALVVRVSRRRWLSEFVKVVELPLMTWHRWGHPLPVLAVAVDRIRQLRSLISFVDI